MQEAEARVDILHTMAMARHRVGSRRAETAAHWVSMDRMALVEMEKSTHQGLEI
jgi:hypothetical protein